MKLFLISITLFLFSFSTVAQNNHPMKIEMVSVFIKDPAKAFKYYTEVLGFEEVMFAPESYIAIVKSPLDNDGTTILLEPTEPGGLEIARQYKQELYEMGIPVISFSAIDIRKTVAELKEKGVKFKLDPEKTSYGFQAIFDDDNGNFIQLLQLN